MTGTQTTTNAASPNQNAAAADPVLNLATNGSHCPVTHASDGAATAGPGVATYDSPPLPRDYTMIGATRVTVPHTGSGSDLQLDARLYDLFPDGTQVMVDRGPRRLLSANEVTTWELHGAGWHFPAGHRIRIELAQDDDPFVQASNVPSSLTLQGATLSIPVRQASAIITGGAAAPKGTRAMRVTVSPRRTRAGRRVRFTFKVTTVVNGKRRPVRGVLIRFRGHKARTGRRGRAHIRAKLRRAGRYRASATHAGYGRASVRVRAMRSRR
jgi:predicted acyl esterase